MAPPPLLRRTPPAQGGLLGAVMVGAVKENRATSSAKAEQRLAGACAWVGMLSKPHAHGLDR